jgi:predicted amidohydrolase YtcJ
MEGEKEIFPSCAIDGEKIVGVGDVSEMKGILGDGFVEVDMRGGTLLPGFVDCHIHLTLTAFSRMNLDLARLKSIGELLSIVKEKIDKSPPGKWILGLRFREDDYVEKRMPTIGELDSVSPGNPVILVRYDGHSAVANSRALGEANITKDTPDPDGGIIVKEGGELTGLLKELAVGLVLDSFPIPDMDEFRLGHEIISKELLACGIVGVHSIMQTTEEGPSGTLGPFEVPIFKLFEENIPQRVHPLIGAPSVDGAIKALSENFGAKKIDGMWRGGAIKLWSDGTFGSRTAYLSEDYEDLKGARGMMVNKIETLRDIILDAQREGLQVAAHAIGDLAVTELVGVFLEAKEKYGDKNLRHRIEHAGMINPKDYPDIKKAGLVCSVQPSFIVSEGSWIRTRVGERVEHVYPFRSIIDGGIAICGGSDTPVEEPEVLSGVWGMVKREGFTKDQALAPFEALSLYTSRAAYASFDEDTRGTISVGKLADLTLLDKNPMNVSTEEIKDIRVLKTIIGGDVVWEG